MRRRAAIMLTGVLLAAATACSSSPTLAAPSAPAPPPAASTPTAPPASSPTPAAPAAPPTPDAATVAKYIAALTAIDPEIVNGKPDKAVSRGRDQCTSVAQSPQDRPKLVELANKRFLGPTHPDGFGAAKAEKILDAVRTYICPTL